jgi:hypothetical protein
MQRLPHTDSKARRVGPVSLILGAALATIVAVEPYPVSAQTIPSDALDTSGCPVPAATFNSWFQSGTPSVNGVVNPANSVAFNADSFSVQIGNQPAFQESGICAFFQWADQMFLWLLSPAPPNYGGGPHIFESPTFYDVSPPDSSNGNRRTLTRHVPGQLPFVGVRSPTQGPHGLPVMMDQSHRLFEVVPAKLAPNGKQLILNGAGEEVEVESADITNGNAVFKDAAGKVIAGPKPIIRPELLPRVGAPRVAPEATPTPGAPQAPGLQIVQRFTVNSLLFFIDPLGLLVTPLNPEEGQAEGGDVLLSQGKSVVYYTIVVNDVYAYFLTGNKTGGITPPATQFPTTAADLANIVAFAKTSGITFPDPNALTVESKMSWVDASTLSDPGNYITASATVPSYNTSNSSQWVATGRKNITLALVGVHFVATVAKHSEMIWASFEHFGNTPNAAYTYTSNSGSKTVPQDSAGKWLFCVTNCPTNGAFNIVHAQVDGTGIGGIGSPITPSNTQRINPFGQPGTFDNTPVVSLNHSVLSQLLSGDIRKNYFMLGATWTAVGGAPTSVPPSNTSGDAQVGTPKMTNSTMETYVQGTNCFSCHDNMGLPGGMLNGLSHIYTAIQPLP